MKQAGNSRYCFNFLFAAAIAASTLLYGQTINQQLPDAPNVSLSASAGQNQIAPQQGLEDALAVQHDDSASGGHPRLTLKDAEAMAIKNNPRVSVARLLALAQHQVVRETRAAELPTGIASITAEKAEYASRISAGSLTASRLFEHAGAGGGFTQLITDFGRTGNLVASSKLQEKAQNANALASTEDIVLAADQAFFNALQALALLKVADQNVSTRQTTETQVSEMTKNKLKSTLDQSFADVNLSQGKLLLLDAQSNVDSTMAALDAIHEDAHAEIECARDLAANGLHRLYGLNAHQGTGTGAARRRMGDCGRSSSVNWKWWRISRASC